MLIKTIVTFFCITVLLPCSIHASEREYGTLIFEDQFERNESQEDKDELNNGWGTNSRTRAAGNKQVDLKDGTLHIYRHKVADHGVSVTQDVSFRNGTVALRFKLGPKEDLGLNFADMKEKSVHAGHLFMVKIMPHKVELIDLKTGRMNLKNRDALKSNTASRELTQLLKTKMQSFQIKLDTSTWHDVVVNIEGDTLSVHIDGKELGEFTSEGIAHSTKSRLRLAVNKTAWVDDVKIWRRQ